MMGNKLTTLPEGVCELTNLYRLGLKGNQLEALPDSFGNLVNLVEIFLTDNALKSLPESMKCCIALVKLQVWPQHSVSMIFFVITLKLIILYLICLRCVSWRGGTGATSQCVAVCRPATTN